MALQELRYPFESNTKVLNDGIAVSVVTMGGHGHKNSGLEADVLAHSIGYNSYLKGRHPASDDMMLQSTTTLFSLTQNPSYKAYKCMANLWRFVVQLHGQDRGCPVNMGARGAMILVQVLLSRMLRFTDDRTRGTSNSKGLAVRAMHSIAIYSASVSGSSFVQGWHALMRSVYMDLGTFASSGPGTGNHDFVSKSVYVSKHNAFPPLPSLELNSLNTVMQEFQQVLRTACCAPVQQACMPPCPLQKHLHRRSECSTLGGVYRWLLAYRKPAPR